MFVARNSGHFIKSQLCLTYHFALPDDGSRVKAQLNVFLTRLRKYRPGVHYLWVLEFQERGFPHFHLFTDIPPEDHEFRLWAAYAWNGILGESEENLKFQIHPKNFLPWNMKSGKYLVKQYLAKVAQKQVPENYHNVGRFWGNSRNMKPVSGLVIPGEDCSYKTYKKACRIVAKRYEKRIKKYVRKNLRNKVQTISLPSLSTIFIQLIQYFNAQEGDFYELRERRILLS